MEVEPPGPNQSSKIPLVGDEPSRAVGVDHMSESGKAADTYAQHAKVIHAWRNVGFMRDLVKIITDCPNTQPALWSNRSGDEMRQIIKNTVHSLTHIMGLPLHRIAFAWAGDQSTPVHKLLPHLSTSADKHKAVNRKRDSKARVI